QGWMNQLHAYDPELFHPSLTHSVHASLDGATLKLSYPKSNIPRRATFEEEILDVAFIGHRSYDLSDAKVVFLCPSSLARKRTWNKKYPICILLAEPAAVECRSSEEQDAELRRDEGMKKAPALGQDIPGDCRERCLYLFGRTGREKEEWYQHLVRAARGTPSSSRGEARAGETMGTGPGWELMGAGRMSSWEAAGSGGDPQGSPARGGGPSLSSWLGIASPHTPSSLVSPGAGPALLSSGSSSGGSAEDITSAILPKDLAGNVRQKIFLDYSTYMAQCMPARAGSPQQSPCHSSLGSPVPTKGIMDSVPTQVGEDTAGRSQACMAWMNALVGRIFWDFLREQYWAEQVSNKIQKKLSKIKLPYFMNELALTELDMGTSIPSVLSASNPTINDRGLWVDLEVTYSGSLQMTLETKMNLCKLGKESAAEESSPAEAGGEGARPRLLLLADSDAESSSAGSSDEEEVATAEPAGALGDRVPPPGTEGHVSSNSTSRKILRFVDKIAKSKYFQRATENEFIKKKIEEVSNTPLLLTVEVQELAGTLAVNIPPPPTDRVWYSFRVPPQLELKVRPKLGEREVTFLHVTEWIEKKLKHEFQKILVMPNMDDLIIPIMRSGLDL
ncbi:TEX2 protein, partial [Centropus bengalensis]|nr:TEX2 protein [Centropus bengalensis]